MPPPPMLPPMSMRAALGAHAAEAPAHQPLELLGVVAALEGELLGDAAGLHVLGQRHVHRLHAVASARLHRRVDLVHLAFADQVADRRRGHEHLARDRATLTIGGRDQLLRDHALQRRRQLHPHLLLLMRWEHVDDAVDRLRRVLGVQRREHEVTGLGGGDRGRDRLEVTHLADEDHVGVLAEHVLQGVREAVGVGAHLTLVHDAALVLVQELDRVLDGHDVATALGVHHVDHRCQRRRLARSGRAGHDHEPPLETGEVGHHRRQTELVDLLDLERDHAERRTDRVALHVHVDTEPGPARQRVRHVELELLLEPFPQLLRQDRVDHALQRPRRQGRVSVDALQLTVDPDDRCGTGREVQVGTLVIEQRSQQFGDRDLDVLILLHGHAHVTSPPSRLPRSR